MKFEVKKNKILNGEYQTKPISYKLMAKSNVSQSNLNILYGSPLDIVFVALNPTIQAIKNGAVFSHDRSFWNILHKAGITGDTSSVHLNNLADEVFRQHKHSKLKLGFADLLPHIYQTNSNKVKVAQSDVLQLSTQLAQHKTEKVALMGQKVVDAFAKVYPNLTSWANINSASGKKQFGMIGTITVNNHKMKVYAMPFPVNNNIPNKHDDFKKLLI